MAKRKDFPPFTPRGREVLVHVINAVALGTNGDEGEIGVIAERLGTTLGRLGTILRRMEGWVTVENGFVYPTVAALRRQNPAMSVKEARAIVKKVNA